ncbi:MAG: NAD(P)H-dependent oxidoreductase [Verrucomicrobiales bacterium]|nr:NAD(P)H-dependent oxidoreductase [Verrucomicrobiales bacterium]
MTSQANNGSPASVTGPLRWRYAVKAFDPAKSIPVPVWDALEEALVLTPSSFGLQPWLFLILTDRALRERLVAHAWGQRQVVDCSHFVAFCVRTKLGEPEIDEYLLRIKEVRGTPLDRLAGLRNIMVGALLKGPMRSEIKEWAGRQAYIALGNFMTAAAMLGIDTCPMEGFDPAKFDDILELAPRGYTCVVCCAAGYRASDDRYASLPKVRYERGRVVEHR